MKFDNDGQKAEFYLGCLVIGVLMLIAFILVSNAPDM